MAALTSTGLAKCPMPALTVTVQFGRALQSRRATLHMRYGSEEVKSKHRGVPGRLLVPDVPRPPDPRPQTQAGWITTREHDARRTLARTMPRSGTGTSARRCKPQFHGRNGCGSRIQDTQLNVFTEMTKLIKSNFSRYSRHLTRASRLLPGNGIRVLPSVCGPGVAVEWHFGLY